MKDTRATYSPTGCAAAGRPEGENLSNAGERRFPLFHPEGESHLPIIPINIGESKRLVQIIIISA